MNGDNPIDPVTDRKGETFVIMVVTTTVCVLATFCVVVQGLSMVWKLPDMNTTLSNAFMHISDTIVGAMLGWTAKSGAQRMFKPDEVKITNTPTEPVPTTESPTT